MKIQEKWDKLLIRHKKLIAGMGYAQLENPDESPLLSNAIKTGEMLALIYSECMCEKCKKEDNLTIHHIIDRRYKKYTDFWKYETQRRYWANMIVLCTECHSGLHGFKLEDNPMLIIPDKILNKIKKHYLTQTLNT
jgi:5-methylcytosine-specific restriction endonuclease McrA